MAVAVISILIAIIIPAIGGAQNSAKRAKTRVQFSQWSAAIEQFRQEYGYYPNFSLFADEAISSELQTQQFVQTLTGRQVSGIPMTNVGEVPGGLGLTAGNTKRIMFCSFGTDDLSGGNLLQDSFGNTSIVVLMDKNLSGIIEVPTEYASLPQVTHSDSGTSVTIPPPESPGIRAGVAFYSAGDGRTPVTSW
jgi:type II secretory pathway pseudopilin PulG